MNKKDIKIVSTIFVVIIASICICGCFWFAAIYLLSVNKYWNEPVDVSAVIEYRADELESDKEQFEVLNKVIDKDDAMLIEAMKTAKPVEGMDDLFDYCNGMIEKYFNDKYNLDVSSRLDNLNVLTGDWSFESGIVGCYFNEIEEYENNFYFCEDYFLFSESTANYMKENGTYTPENFVKEDYNFVSTYIHEVLHYLGMMYCETDEMSGFVEGLTEYVTGEVLEYSGIDFKNESGYFETVEIVRQIAKADENLIPEVIKADKTFNFEKYINDIAEFECSDEYGMYLDFISFGSFLPSEDIENDDYIFMAQYYTNELLKKMGIDKKPDNSGLFEIKWLFTTIFHKM